MSTQVFQAKIEKDKSRSVIVLPFDPNEVWGRKDRHIITGTVAGNPVRGPLGFDGKRFYLPLGPAWLRDFGLSAGADVPVSLAAEGPQLDMLPADIAAGLIAEPEARSFFESLATFYRKNYIKWVDGAKQPETRAKRIEEMIGLLKAGKKQR